jgi:predicted MPP superfamily phosphohydrolase
MSPSIWWILVLAVVVGHFGLNLAIYNRLSATGVPRKTLKLIVKTFFAFTILLPPAVVLLYPDVLADLLAGRPQEIPIPTVLLAYASLCLSTWFFLGIPWLAWRPIFGLEWIRLTRETEVVDVETAVARPLALSTKCKLESRIPLNQIFDLAIEKIELPVSGLPRQLDGYRIAHLSDVHLTGDVHPDFTRYAVERATEWRPHLMALTGDIIDKQPCIDWLGEVFAPGRARDGCYYVLGNHDTRIVDSQQTREAMDQAGWTDLGSRGLRRELGGVSTLLIGNEYPWYQRPVIDQQGEELFRLLLSHSPDQLSWARKHNVTLMLAGHTHGGQGRLPLVGALLSPSLHGSRYASGDFFKPPTTMHVTRGLSGVHLLRINCRPELSLLTLRGLRSDDDVST